VSWTDRNGVVNEKKPAQINWEKDLANRVKKIWKWNKIYFSRQKTEQTSLETWKLIFAEQTFDFLVSKTLNGTTFASCPQFYGFIKVLLNKATKMLNYSAVLFFIKHKSMVSNKGLVLSKNGESLVSCLGFFSQDLGFSYSGDQISDFSRKYRTTINEFYFLHFTLTTWRFLMQQLVYS